MRKKKMLKQTEEIILTAQERQEVKEEAQDFVNQIKEVLKNKEANQISI